MWVGIVGCIAWLIFLVLAVIYSEKQDAIFVMNIMRTTLDNIGIAYVKDKHSICKDETLQKKREKELKELSKAYNESFNRYGSRYDADKWLKREE